MELGRGICEREECCAIHLGILAKHTRARRPLRFKEIAVDRGGIQIAFDGERVNHFSALQAHRCQRGENANQRVACFLLKFTACCGEMIFVGLKLAFRKAPGALILIGPKRPTGMHEQHLHTERAASVEEHSGALFGH